MTDIGAATAALPLVAIVGRPNVGKSALFNRVLGRRKAIVEDVPGTTRDRHYAEAEWRGRRFRVVDTGGLLGETLAGDYARAIGSQVGEALQEADAICFVVDVQAGLTVSDREVAAQLREAAQPVYVVANKADNAQQELAATEFHALGLAEPIAVSAHHGRGIGDLLDRVVDGLPQIEAPAEPVACRLAIVGRPNVGKSSLINAILHEDRMIVSPIPGTTRDAVDLPVEFDGQRLVLVDTAGIRRRGKVAAGVERYSVGRARAAIERADVVAVVLDAGEDVAAQDQHITGMAVTALRGIVLVMNKSDLIGPDPEVRERRRRQVRWRSRFVPWAPVVWTSARTGANLDDLLRTALRVGEERRRRLPTGPLNALLRRAVTDHPPPAIQGRPLRFYYVTQAAVAPPTFVFFINQAPERVHFSYRRFLERRIRAECAFEGAAMRLVFRRRSPAA